MCKVILLKNFWNVFMHSHRLADRSSFLLYSPQVVKETLLCHAIIGRAGGKELIMKVAITCEFIAPLMQFSSDRLEFCVEKVRLVIIISKHSNYRLQYC